MGTGIKKLYYLPEGEILCQFGAADLPLSRNRRVWLSFFLPSNIWSGFWKTPILAGQPVFDLRDKPNTLQGHVTKTCCFCYHDGGNKSNRNIHYTPDECNRSCFCEPLFFIVFSSHLFFGFFHRIHIRVFVPKSNGNMFCKGIDRQMKSIR